jgi:hypothetical protein
VTNSVSTCKAPSESNGGEHNNIGGKGEHGGGISTSLDTLHIHLFRLIINRLSRDIYPTVLYSWSSDFWQKKMDGELGAAVLWCRKG